ncbi:MAG TPA: TolC family protein [Blastocatellia bacterium]|nr:TolC family protein [Blastocatellia bacterium]
MNRFATILALILLASEIPAQTKPQPIDLPKEVERRTGHQLKPTADGSELGLPENVTLDDGLTEDEAVAIGLWNNPTWQAELTTLGLARADLIEAGQLRNPSLTLIIPFSTRVLEAVANWPFEALWQRPQRLATARIELNRVGETLISRALDLIRDLRLAYLECLIAQSRVGIAAEARRERAEIVTIINARFRLGEISELETSAAVIESRLAEEQALSSIQEITLTKDRLRAMLGFSRGVPDFNLKTSLMGDPASPEQPAEMERLATTPAGDSPTGALEDLTKQALEARPELKAAELAIEAAGRRAKWERSRILAVSAIAKEYGRGANGFEQGPGVQIELPIFTHNRGGITRAEAEIERAAKQLIAARQRVSTEVQEAYTRLAQARESYRLWRTRVRPPLEEDLRRAERAYVAGDVAYLFVLESSRRLTDSRLRQVELEAAEVRALAQLERSVGRRLIANR